MHHIVNLLYGVVLFIFRLIRERTRSYRFLTRRTLTWVWAWKGSIRVIYLSNDQRKPIIVIHITVYLRNTESPYGCVPEHITQWNYYHEYTQIIVQGHSL